MTRKVERAEAGESERLRRRATWASVAVGSTLAIAKLGAWLLTGSVTILSSLMDSLVDVLASLVTFFTVRVALEPPDRTHRFGHGKAEPLGALAQAAFVAGSGLFVIFQAVQRLIAPQPIEAAAVGLSVMVFSIVLTAGLVAYQRHVIRRTGSVAIRADSLHYVGDLLINMAVIATLVVTIWLDLAWLDPVVAIGIAGYLIWTAGRIVRSSLDILMDRELPWLDRQKIRTIVRAHPGVVDLHDLRTRSGGTRLFIELHAEMDGELTLNQAHEIADDLEAALGQAFPDAEIIVHQEPAGLVDARLDDRIAEGQKARRGE